MGIRDVNAFLFGNFVPDVYVGYMVKPISRVIEYRDTHFADPGYVPEPRYWEFWQRFGMPSADMQGRVSDMVLGAWCHLVADNAYNHNVNAFLERGHIAPGEQTRIRKQGDFDLFGRTLDISLTCVANDALLAQAAAFPQYTVAERDVRASIAAAEAIVQENQRLRLDEEPSYSMLSRELFLGTFSEVQERIVEGLEAYARKGAEAPELRRERVHA